MNTQTSHATTLVGGEWIHQDGDHTALMITKCHNCGSTWFPPREICSKCASGNVEQTRTGNYGIAYASTVVRIGPAAFQPPYVLAYVDLDGARFLAHVDADEALAPNTPVELRVGAIGEDDTGALSSYIVAEVTELPASGVAR
ncbi:zinc ribbon domain-containing protein [Arthrobacter sp. ISL-28]|uniref:Zn-ribbon domain-containing OB-fold protein n=1 Tax=Arthrobacter sp. ISL-28 TaxID=2819108 RepID=UPI002889BDED|nr:zinc ribbon domain-containing protein [Arthrobacter sp. ISL-28]